MLYISQIAVLTILAYLGIVLLGPFSYSRISFFYFATPFVIMFSMWWGFWGMVGFYISNLVGSGILVGVGLVPSVIIGLAAIALQMIIFVAYRGYLSKRGLDPFFRGITFREVDGVKAKRVQA
ncbi:MAG: hypothetical protein QW837_07450 [Conexivisphaerales archaeon]